MTALNTSPMFIAPPPGLAPPGLAPPGLAPPGLDLPEGTAAHANIFLQAEHNRWMRQYMEHQQAKLAWQTAFLREKLMKMPPTTWQQCGTAKKDRVSLKLMGFLNESPVSTEPPSDDDDEIVIMSEGDGAEASEDETGMDEKEIASHTTILMRNVPRSFSRQTLTDLLNREGFRCKYTFIYLPFNFGSGNTLGYAFVNLASNSVADSFLEHFHGFTEWGVCHDQVCSVERTNDQQGLAANIDRYRNSPVMHDLVPDMCKPLILENGVPVAFPLPTVAIRHPPRRLLLGNLAPQS